MKIKKEKVKRKKMDIKKQIMENAYFFKYFNSLLLNFEFLTGGLR